MSRLARAVEILEAINKFYQEQDGMACPLYPGALILSNDTTIADAVRDCIGAKEAPVEPWVPHSKRRRWAYSFRYGYSGWIGKRKIKKFSTYDEAVQWANETQS